MFQLKLVTDSTSMVILTDPLRHLKLQTLPLPMIAVTTVHCPALVVLMVAVMRVFAPLIRLPQSAYRQ